MQPGRQGGNLAEDKSARQENLRIYEESWSEWLDMKQHGPSSRWLRALLLDALRSTRIEPLTVLDVGCGEGTNTELLARQFPGASVVGIDQSSEAIRLASARYNRANLRFRFQESGGASEPQFDLVACLEVLEHVDDWRHFLDGLCDRSGHYLLLSFPTGHMRPFEKFVGHVRNFSPGQVEKYLEGRGFLPASIAYAGFPFYSPLYREICQIANAGTNQFTRGRYTWKQKVVSEVILFAFRRLSTQRRWGDQFVGLFLRSSSESRR
jgi:trans-aconitate methyltransferase